MPTLSHLISVPFATISAKARKQNRGVGFFGVAGGS